MQWGVAEIERTDGGPRPSQRARHAREVAPDQVDHAGAENFSNVGIDVGDFTARFGFENRRNAFCHHTHSSRRVSKGALRAVPTICQNHCAEWWARFRLRSLSYGGQVALPTLQIYEASPKLRFHRAQPIELHLHAVARI